jgi:hypothetical protein
MVEAITIHMIKANVYAATGFNPIEDRGSATTPMSIDDRERRGSIPTVEPRIRVNAKIIDTIEEYSIMEAT